MKKPEKFYILQNTLQGHLSHLHQPWVDPSFINEERNTATKDADSKYWSFQRTVGRYIYISKENQTQTPWVFVGRPELQTLG